jgi:hypothetical protein
MRIEREPLLGALPMSNVLAFGLLIGRRRRESSPFLLGFEIFGALAVASSVAVSILFPGRNGAIFSYVSLLLSPIEAVISRDQPFVFIPTACSLAVLMLGLPQVAVAVTGGYLFRWLKSQARRPNAHPRALNH